MPLNPPPTVQANVLLVTQQLKRSDMSRAAQLDFCLVCADSTVATYQDAVDDFQANFNAQFGPNFDAEVVILPPTGRGGDGSDVPLLVIDAGAAGAGANVDNTVPPNVALLLRKRTSLSGRKNRGRSYFPFLLRQADVGETGAIAGGAVSGFQGEANTFLAQLVTDSTPMHIENKAFNTPLPPHFVTAITASSAAVTAFTVETVVATQRRRLNR